MTFKKTLRITLLSAAISLVLVGCGDDSKEMSQQEVQYLSHLDQSRFFQRQGELKASTLEARSAIELNPGSAEPYFIIVDNLVTAGDAVNAEKQVQEIAARLDKDKTTDTVHNRILLITARTQMMRNQSVEALASLDNLRSPDSSQQLEAAILRGDVKLRAGDASAARKAYQDALSTDENSALALIGLSRTAYADKNISEAKSYIEKAEKVDANDPELWLWKAQIAQVEERWQDSEDAYIRALEDIGQYDIMTYKKYATMSALIEVLRAQGKSAEAFVYEEILAKSAPGTIKSNFAAAQDAYQKGNLEESARYLREILNQAPNHIQSVVMLGMIRFQQGRVEEAENLLAPLSKEDSPAINKLLAATQLQLQRPDEAKRLLENLDESQSDPSMLALVGIASLATGDTAAGRSYIEKSLELNPENTDLRLRYATYLLQQEEYEAAINQATTAMKQDESNSDARVLIIRAYMQSGDQDAARESASAWVKEQPDNTTALLTHGDLSSAMGDLAEGKQFYAQALKQSPSDPRANIALATLAARQNDKSEAAKQFKEAINKAPNSRRALQGLVQVSEDDDIKAYLDKLLAKQPDAVGPKFVLLEYALMEDHNAKADKLSAELLEPVNEFEPSTHAPVVAGIYRGTAAARLNRDDSKGADKILQRAQVLFPGNEDVALQTASFYFTSDREDDARKLLRETRLEHPESARPYVLEANYEISKNDLDKAAELYELALNKATSPDIYLRLAETLQKQEQRQKAIETLENGKGKYPKSSQLMLALALSYQNIDDMPKAIDAYKAVLNINPKNSTALNNLAWIYHESGDGQALELAQRAYDINPESAAIADTYGWILYKKGDHKESIPVLEKAHQLAPDSNEIAMHLADAYKAAGEEGKAKEVLKKL